MLTAAETLAVAATVAATDAVPNNCNCRSAVAVVLILAAELELCAQLQFCLQLQLY